jgi:hypothetical protein
MHYKFKFPRFTNRKQTQPSAHDVMCAWLKVFILSHCEVFIKTGEQRGLSLIKFASYFKGLTDYKRRSQWPRDLRRRSMAAHQLRLWVRIPPRAWLFVSCECCVLSGRVLRNGPITRPEESYRLCFVVVSDLETSWMRRPCPTGGLSRKTKKKLLQVTDSDVTTAECQIMFHLCFMSSLVTTHSRHYSSPILFVLFVCYHPFSVLSGPAERVQTRQVTLY